MYLIIVSILAFATTTTRAQITSTCYTKNDELGECVGIRLCKPIWEIIRDAPRPLPDRIVEYIKKSHCGSPEDRTICCPREDVTTSTQRPALYQPASRPSNPWYRDEETTSTTSRYEENFGGRRPAAHTPDSVRVPTQQPREIPNEITNSKRETSITSVTEHRNIRLLDTKSCGHLSLDRIANGNHTELLQYPWMAALAYRNNQRKLSFKCGGTLISRRYVITAGHCITNLPPKTGTLELVRLGEFDFETETDCEQLYDEFICTQRPQDVNVESHKIHPEYNDPKHAHDIAIIRLADDADFTHNRIRPVCMPVTEKLLGTVPQHFTVTGWGTTETGYQSSKLMQASMSLYPKDQCLDILSTFTRGLSFTSGQFCADASDMVAVCSGDSGGPLLAAESFFHYGARYVHFGIVSFGPNLCGNRKSYPSVFTDVRYYMKWILDNMRN